MAGLAGSDLADGARRDSGRLFYNLERDNLLLLPILSLNVYLISPPRVEPQVSRSFWSACATKASIASRVMV